MKRWTRWPGALALSLCMAASASSASALAHEEMDIVAPKADSFLIPHSFFPFLRLRPRGRSGR